MFYFIFPYYYIILYDHVMIILSLVGADYILDMCVLLDLMLFC